MLLNTVAVGGWVVASYWSAFTMAWLLCKNFRRVVRREFFIIAVVWTVALLPFAIWFIAAQGVACAGLGLMMWLFPVTCVGSAFLVSASEKARPAYAAAYTKLNYGRTVEAECEIIEQLEKCEDDYEGWMLLAEVYAMRHRDLDVAEKTVLDLCDQPGLRPDQVAAALHKLADWHLRINDDPLAARQVMDEIIRRLPGTDAAQQAQERKDRIPESRETWLLRKRPATHEDDLPSAEEPPMIQSPPADPGQELAEQLRINPDDVPTRERLAHQLAGRGRIDDALEQMLVLLARGDCPPQQRAEWLRTMAQWEFIAYRRAEARKWLEQLVRECPDTPQARSAVNRLQLMDAEDEKRRKARGSSR